MHIHFVLVRRVPPVPSPVLVEVTDRLRGEGFTVTSAIPEAMLTRVDTFDSGDDLVVLKSHTELALSLAAVLHAEGVNLLNPYLSCVSAQDKVTASRRLEACGLPVPASWITADLALAASLLAVGPVVVKPPRGHRGTGVAVVQDRRQLADLAARADRGEPWIVQQHVPGPGEDLKVYVAGNQVWAVRKPFSADSFTRAGRPVLVTEEVRELALACGRAFGLGLFGLDLIEGPAGPVIIDVNYFPGYKGIPGAAAAIAAYIAAYARGDVHLEPGGHRPVTSRA